MKFRRFVVKHVAGAIENFMQQTVPGLQGGRSLESQSPKNGVGTAPFLISRAKTKGMSLSGGKG